MIFFNRLILVLLIATSCKSLGQLKVVGSVNNGLQEVSAAEKDLKENLLWVIQDRGNDNDLIALEMDGSIARSIKIENAENEDWEDLTTDDEGNIYIGDFGNNSEKRKKFTIYKVKYEDLNKKSANAEIIEFTLPKKQDSKDFESFFLLNNHFYIISKEKNKFVVLKVKNEAGKQEAKVHTKHDLKGKNNKITSADISDDGKTIVLLNHDKLWKIDNFKDDDFFEGDLKELEFDHDSQKEGICFDSNNKVIITDERNGDEGGNIYTFSID
tara:strand:+ start:1390 stop:2199 length:810 start_codon:yes stop_codon:yes gene_type:complete